MAVTPVPAVAITGIHHVKLPVSDLDRSVVWYCELFGLSTLTEFVEDGRVCGVALVHPPSGTGVALRDRDAIERPPRLDGFDVFAFALADRAGLEAFAARCDDLGVAYEGIHQASSGWAMQVIDPDGTAIRLYADDPAAAASQATGAPGT